MSKEQRQFQFCMINYDKHYYIYGYLAVKRDSNFTLYEQW